MDLLLGMCDAKHLPFGGRRVAGLRLEKSPWAGGEILRGTVPGLKLPQQPGLVPVALAASRSCLYRPQEAQEFNLVSSYHTVSHTSLAQVRSFSFCAEESGEPKRLPGFWEGEELGAQHRPRCIHHFNCSSC